jgi:thiol:disulfide interchange protein DsbC
MRLIMLLLAATWAVAAQADEAKAGQAEIRQAVQNLAPDTKVKSIAKSPVAGLYEVTLDGPRGPLIVYATEKGDHLLLGELLDVKGRRNLTAERMDKLTAVDFDKLPFAQAIKVVKGDGKRKLAVFSDPDCPYCRKLEPELAKLNNVTIYTFPYPLPMHPDAGRKAKQVWCAKDRVQAWDDLMLRGKLPDGGKADCDHPLDKNLALGARLNIQGTPAIIFASGQRIPGYVEAGRIEQMLNQGRQ